jgi:hypothetical protein
MYRRLASLKSPEWLILSLVLVALLTLAGCPPVQKTDISGKSGTAETTGPLNEVAGADALRKAQNDFNEAAKQLKPGETTPAEARAKYQQVVTTIANQVLPNVSRNDLKVTAYALEAFAQWQLHDDVTAINTANQGKKLCDGTATNPRDCAMLQMVGGLVVASQAYTKYKDAPTLSQDQVKDFSNRMEAALNEINAVNRFGDRQDLITIYANQWQLMIVREATNFWFTYFRQDATVWKPAVLKWLSRADQIMKQFPETPYPNQDLTLRLKDEFARLKQKAEAPS